VDAVQVQEMALTKPVHGKTKQRERKTPEPITESDDDFDEEASFLYEGFTQLLKSFKFNGLSDGTPS